MGPLKPLVIRFGAFGDMVLLIPMLRLLQQRYGRSCDLVSSGSWTNPLMQRVPSCDSIRLLTSRRAPYWFNRSQWQLVDFLRHRPRGPVYVFESDEKSHSFLRRAGISPDWICSLRDLPAAPGEHIARHALRLARQTPPALRNIPDYRVSTSEAPSPRPALREADRRDCRQWLERHRLADSPLVLIQPGNKKTMKGGNRQRPSNVDYWPESHWGNVIAGVRKFMPTAQVVICGAPSEYSLAQDVVAQIPHGADRVFIACNELPVPRLLALQEIAHSMISVNTGPAHSAAAMGTPAVVMFTRHAHRAFELYAPVPTTAPVKIVQPVSKDPDAYLDTITPSAVLAAWQDLVTSEINTARVIMA